MVGDGFCDYRTPCGFCTKFDKYCTEKGPMTMEVPKVTMEPDVAEKILKEAHEMMMTGGRRKL